MTEYEVRPPEECEEIPADGPGMSNFLHMIDPEFESLLKTFRFYGHHAAQDFNGDVWFQQGDFHESVYRLHVFQGHYTAPTLRELMTKVNDKHGWR